jgi:kynurenine formamidase
MVVTEQTCKIALESEIQTGDIIVIRNDTGIKLTKQQMYMGDDSPLPKISLEAAKWLAKYTPKLLVLDFIRFGDSIEEIREFHDILMSKDTCLVEFVENLDKISQ